MAFLCQAQTGRYLVSHPPLDFMRCTSNLLTRTQLFVQRDLEFGTLSLDSGCALCLFADVGCALPGWGVRHQVQGAHVFDGPGRGAHGALHAARARTAPFQNVHSGRAALVQRFTNPTEVPNRTWHRGLQNGGVWQVYRVLGSIRSSCGLKT